MYSHTHTQAWNLTGVVYSKHPGNKSWISEMLGCASILLKFIITFILLHTQAWNLTGDVYSKHPGNKPWISEMFGYAFAAAKSNVWHKWDPISMIYPSYTPTG